MGIREKNEADRPLHKVDRVPSIYTPEPQKCPASQYLAETRAINNTLIIGFPRGSQDISACWPWANCPRSWRERTTLYHRQASASPIRTACQCDTPSRDIPAKRHNRKARKNQHPMSHVLKERYPKDERTRQGNANAVIWGSAYRRTLHSAGAFVSVSYSALGL
jgi:hypothetical protein